MDGVGGADGVPRFVVNATDMVTGDGVMEVAVPAIGVRVTCAGAPGGGTRDSWGRA